MIVFSAALVASEGFATSGLWPAFGWDNQVTTDTIAADHEDADYPASNLANPQTSSLWKSGSTADQYITITLTGDTETDYLGVARHNWGSGLVLITVEGITAEPGAVWEELDSERYLADDTPAMFLFEPGFYVGLRFKLEPDAVEPQAAVIYAGKSLRMPTGIPPGHTPLFDALDVETISTLSERGEFLGDIVVSQQLTSSVEFRLIDGDWYRANMRDFVRQRDPFFFAWSPLYHPDECAFAKFSGNPRPVINQATGEVDITLGLIGLAL
jgi:hypothetical protein